MQNYHMNLDWGDIGYNFAIGGDGRVYEGVGWPRQGIHTLGWNTKSYGIGFIGNFAKVKPNAKMLKAARLLIMCGIQKKFMTQSVELHGARDATCTESPGDALYKIIKQWPMFKGGPLEEYRC
ncbi:peptidoglycan-recognition protein 1 [Caerostris extrusa]|uniref:Peptidoglycan-recognition protein 1 n=1 Tax=Caerostris extrusa TaxID=172846 RepID=A0AAV4P562_CAEEX|nr:peptidoglycan-recognition protein 1 [Caerostris extrusa]